MESIIEAFIPKLNNVRCSLTAYQKQALLTKVSGELKEIQLDMAIEEQRVDRGSHSVNEQARDNCSIYQAGTAVLAAKTRRLKEHDALLIVKYNLENDIFSNVCSRCYGYISFYRLMIVPLAAICDHCVKAK